MTDFLAWLTTMEGAVVWCGACYAVWIPGLILLDWWDERRKGCN